MKKTELDLPLSRKQLYSIAEAEGRFNLWEGSVRSGKTVGSLFRWFMFLANPPPGGQFVMIGRTRDSLSRNVIDPMRDPEVFGEFADTVQYVQGAPSGMIMGRRVHMFGASDAKAEKIIRGLTVAGAYVDELTVIAEDFFKQLTGRMSPPGARLFATTNPDSPQHWLKRGYLDRIHEFPDWRTWHFILDDNPGLPESYKESIKREHTGLWHKRFVLGEWVAAEGAIYDMWDEDEHIVRWEDLPTMVEYLAVGIDYGTTNPTVALLLGIGVDGVLYMVDEWAYVPPTNATRKTDRALAQGVQEWYRQPHQLPMLDERTGFPRVEPDLPPIVADPAAASFRVQMLEDGFPTHAAENDVLYGIRTMSSLLATGRLKVSDRCRLLIREVPGYVWDPDKTAKGEDAPLKINDHACDAARYALATTERRWRQYIELPSQRNP